MTEALKLQLMGLPAERILTEKEANEGIVHNPESLTMISYNRLTNLEQLIYSVVFDSIPGDIIETGVWRGGACIFISKLLTQLKSDKRVFVADSFEGLPAPDDKYIYDKGDYHYKIDFLSVSLETVEASFIKHKCEDNYIFVKGWFKDSLHLLNNKFSIIRLDGDMYESTIQALEALYPKLSIGGYCIIDDYKGVYQCPFAVEDYRKEHQITDKLIDIDNTAVYWQKTK